MHLERASAGPACPSCGVGLPAGARFCPSCGARIVAGAPERRVVTVLFADLVDSTSLVVSLDPEAARDRLDQMFRLLAMEVRRRGGTVEKYVGDAILAVFGFPTTHGDDAARAVQAALAMREAARSLGARLTDFRPRLRIGLDTGEVVAGAYEGDLRLSGEAVHTAARIQQAAAPDQVLASVRTLRAVGDSADTGPPRRIVARGTQRPVEVVEVHGLAPAAPGAGATMVDRERDLPSLVRALERATEENRLVLLVGEAGIGKSTLAKAATERLGPQVRVLWGRCLPEWHSLPLWPVREVLAAAAGVAVAEPVPRLAAEIGRLVVEVWPEPETAANAASAVCRLIGLQSHELQGPPNEFGARELAAILAGVLARLAAQQPTLVILEDIHCASRDLLEVAAILITGGLRTPGHLGFLGISRPDAAALDPDWIAQTRTERIDLASLPQSATSELLAFTLGEHDPASQLSERVFEASHGNPLFVKELALAIRETGEPPDRPSLPIPDSLRALIGARLDRLPAERRGMLCRAAVIGRWFSPTALASLVQEETEQLERDLDELAGSGFIERLPQRLTGDRRGYAFHHVLFRDVAYSLLPKASRSELHERLAAWLASGDEREPSESVAPHLVEAVRLAREVRRPTVADQQLASRAVAVCRRAAQRLREQEALVAAASMLDDALDIAGIAGTPAEDLAELRMLRGTLRGVTGDAASALEDLRAATSSGRAALRAQAYIELSNLYGIMNDYHRASAMAEPAVAEARAARSPALLARALRAKALEPFVTGDLMRTAALLEEALSISGAEAGSGLAIDLRSTLLPVRLYLATPLPRLAEQAEALATAARANGRRNAEAGASWVLGEVRLLQGDLATAERLFAAADRQRRDIGLTAGRVWSLLGLARAALGRGDPRRARRLAEEAVEITRTPDGLAEPDAYVHLAEAHLAGEDPALAAAALERARASLQPDDVVLAAEVERVEARLAGARGDHQTAAALLRHALAALASTDYRLDWLRTAAQLVPALDSAGHHGEAAEVAAEVRRHATEIGAHSLVRGLPEAVP
jgi:class 3 adenylate cyclase/tetratricopeptide (TPR) repeat protein